MTDLGWQTDVPDGLAPLLVDIFDLQTHPDNARKGNIDAIAASLKRYGQLKPIVVQKSTNYIVAGNHTFRAAHRLGWKQIAALVVDMDDRTALGYLLADNHASDLAEYERDRLVQLLDRVADGGFIEDTLWSIDELDNLYAETERALTPKEEFRGGYSIDEAELAKIAEKSATASPVGRMREMPVVMSVEEHGAFVRRLAELEKHYGTPGKIATLIECVRREAERIGVA